MSEPRYAVTSGHRLHTAECHVLASAASVDALSRAESLAWLAAANERDLCRICVPEIVRPPRRPTFDQKWPNRCGIRSINWRCCRVAGHEGDHAYPMPGGAVVTWGPATSALNIEWAQAHATPDATG